MLLSALLGAWLDRCDRARAMDDEAWLYKADDESAGAKKDENGVENRSQREIGQALKQSLPEFMLDPSIWVTFWRALPHRHASAALLCGHGTKMLKTSILRAFWGHLATRPRENSKRAF